MTELMRLVQVSQNYSGFIALHPLDLTICQGQCLGIVGESGCGKSTLARMMALIDLPATGQVIFKGEPADIVRHRQEIQYVFQDPVSAFPPRMKIKRFLEEPFINFRLCKKKAISIEIQKLLGKTGLDASVLERYPHQLSGGQLQRIVIARALATHPQLMICDEITSALDVIVQNEIMDLLKKLQEEEDLTLIFISHDLSIVSHFCDEILVMDQGYPIEYLKANELFKAKHPAARRLLDALITI